LAPFIACTFSVGLRGDTLYISGIAMPFKGPNPPAEPTDFDPNDRYKDPVVYFQHREALLAEHTLKEAEIRVRLAPVTAYYTSIPEISIFPSQLQFTVPTSYRS